jgi:hypothetical protein
MEPEEIVRLWDATAELARDGSRDAGLRRLALRQYFAALVGPDEVMDARLAELEGTLEQLQD